jgi:hypothetical protein
MEASGTDVARLALLRLLYLQQASVLAQTWDQAEKP